MRDIGIGAYRMSRNCRALSITVKSTLRLLSAFPVPERGHPERLWSSTTFAADSTYAWSVDFAAGDVDTSPKTDAEIVRAVGGP